MFKGILISIVFIVLAAANVAVSADFGVDEADIKNLKSAIKYVGQKNYERAIHEAAITNDEDILELVLWMMYQKGYEGSGYEELKAFTIKNSDWPRLKVIQNKAEFSLTDGLDPKVVVGYFKNDHPVTGHAMRILAEAKIALGHDDEEINKLLKQAWKQGDFSYEDEKSFIKKHITRLDSEDHLERIDRLLWEHKITAAKRVMRHVHSSYKTLFTARIYLITRRRGVDKIIARIDPKLKSNPGLLYDRIKWHMKRKNYSRAIQYIADVKETMPYQNKWWKIRNRLVRELIEKRKYREAYELVKNSGNEEGTPEFAESAWLGGWLSYILNKKSEAYEHFYAMYRSVNFPVSKARAGYWAGRVSEETGNDDVAEKWYKLAASNPTTFYGQIAHVKAYPDKQLKINDNYNESYVYRLKYEKNKLIKIAYLLLKAGQTGKSKWFLKTAIDSNKSADEMNYISKFGINMNEIEFSVIAAKQAIKKSVVLTHSGWPIVATNEELYADKPLVMAIIRQESLFDTSAKSGAGARGLMQIMPATAKYISRKIHKKYNKYHLTSKPEYNMQLGSYYINSLVDRFDGSHVLAIASYNAGPTNVKKWIDRYGDPRNAKNPEQVINWIEHVPFKETRNYIQRVLENVQVYKHKMESHVVDADDYLMKYNTKLSSN